LENKQILKWEVLKEVSGGNKKVIT
jgi:hypothetical protein